MLVSNILDETELERMVTGFREEELILHGLELADIVIREPGRIVFKYVREPKAEETFIGTLAEFDGKPVVRFYYPGGLHMYGEDKVYITYTLTWHYEGRGGDDRYVILPPNSGNAKDYHIVFEFTAA